MTDSSKAKCGNLKRDGSKKPCARPAGWGTDHPGEGPCKLHGGAKRIKHGRYSSIKRATLKAKLDAYKKDPDPLNLSDEVALLRATIHEQIDVLDADEPDFGALGQLVDKLGSMVDRVHKHKTGSSVSLATLNRVIEQLGVEVVAAVKETIEDADKRTAVCEAVERRWATIRLDAYSTSDQGAS